MIRKCLYSLGLIFVSVGSLFAQSDEGEVTQIQPTIMVVPYTSSKENILDKYESDDDYRTVIDYISSFFDDRGFVTHDFQTELESIDRNQAAGNGEHAFQDGVMNQIVENSPADIFVETELIIKPSSYEGRSVNVRLIAKEKYTAEKLATMKPITTRPNKTANLALLVEKSLDENDAVDEFLNTMNARFTDMNREGRSIKIRIRIGENATIKLDDELGVNGDYLSDLIIDWAEANAYKNYADTKGVTSSLIYFYKLKIPLRDESGNNYNITAFARKMRNAIRSMGLLSNENKKYRVKKSVNGAEILLTIQ